MTSSCKMRAKLVADHPPCSLVCGEMGGYVVVGQMALTRCRREMEKMEKMAPHFISERPACCLYPLPRIPCTAQVRASRESQPALCRPDSLEGDGDSDGDMAYAGRKDCTVRSASRLLPQSSLLKLHVITTTRLPDVR